MTDRENLISLVKRNGYERVLIYFNMTPDLARRFEEYCKETGYVPPVQAFAAMPTEEEVKQILFDLPEKYNDGRTYALGNSAGYVRLKDITSSDVTFEELQRLAETYLFTLKAGSEAVGYLSVKHQNDIWDVNGSEASYLTDRMEYYDTDCIMIMADSGSYLVSEDGRFCFLDAWKSTVKLDTFEELMLCVSYESVTALERSYSNISSEVVYGEAFCKKQRAIGKPSAPIRKTTGQQTRRQRIFMKTAYVPADLKRRILSDRYRFIRQEIRM